MSGKSDYLEKAILAWMGGTAMPTAPTTIYVALFTAAPADTGGGTEVTGGSYARQAITLGTVASASPGNQRANTNTITFPTATASWGTVTHFAIFDASTAGNQLYNNALTASQTIASGNQAQFAPGNLVIKED